MSKKIIVSILLLILIFGRFRHLLKNSNTEFFDVILISDDDTKTKISADNFQSNLAKYSFILTTVPTKLALKAGGTSHVEAMKIIPSNQYKINSKDMKIPKKNLDRFMELSALAYFNGKLLTCDDRTGIIMEIDENAQKSDVWFSLLKYDSGFKCEWMTVKNGKLFVGSFGKNYVDTETGDIIHSRFTKVFMINKDKKTEILEWKENYDKINEQLGKSTGEEFVIHEAIEWVEQLKMWFILPRKIGDGPYTEEKDSLASANKLIICSENFSQCTGSDYGAREAGKGFSDIKFIDITNKLPTSIGLIVATRTFETIDERFKSQISIGRCYKPVQGTIFPKCYETQLYELPDNHKYEGVYVKRIEGFFRRLQLSILSSFY